jgi:hypothetical protein
MFALDAATVALVAIGLAMVLVLFVATRLLPAYTAEGRRLETRSKACASISRWPRATISRA